MLMKIEIVLFCFVVACVVVETMRSRNFDYARDTWRELRRMRFFSRFARLRIRDIRDAVFGAI